MTQTLVKDSNKVKTVPLQILKLDSSVQTPKYESKGSAGFDLRAFLNADSGLELNADGSFTLKAGTRSKIPTGLKFVIPQGYEVQIRPRSGLAYKKGISLTNTPGTIDSDYRGEIQILIINHGKEDFTINNDDRIAQAVIAPVWQADFNEITAMPDETDNSRGEGGFGSTGTK